MSDEVIGIITWPEGTAALDLRVLVQTKFPVIVEYGGKRFQLTDWNEAHAVFTGIQLDSAAEGEQ